jgi:hypothetical protein
MLRVLVLAGREGGSVRSVSVGRVDVDVDTGVDAGTVGADAMVGFLARLLFELGIKLVLI